MSRTVLHTPHAELARLARQAQAALHVTRIATSNGAERLTRRPVESRQTAFRARTVKLIAHAAETERRTEFGASHAMETGLTVSTRTVVVTRQRPAISAPIPALISIVTEHTTSRAETILIALSLIAMPRTN